MILKLFFFFWVLCVWVSDTGFPCVCPSVLQLPLQTTRDSNSAIPLPLPPECWDERRGHHFMATLKLWKPKIKLYKLKKTKTKTETQEHTHTIIKKKRKTLKKKKTTLNLKKKPKNKKLLNRHQNPENQKKSIKLSSKNPKNA